MKYISSILVLFFIFTGLHSQVLPTLPSKPKPQPAATKQPKPQTVSKTANNPAPAGSVQTIKFMSDAEGDLYIDGEKKGRLKPNMVLRLNLKKGTYLIKVVSTANSQDELNEKYTVEETGSEFLYELKLQAAINFRLQEEQERQREEERQRERARQKEMARQKELELQQKMKEYYDAYLKNVISVTIGTQVWMQQNLNVDRFRNGDPIPEAKNGAEWKQYGEQGKPCWCYYNNDPANGKIYGKLYNWYTVNDPRGVAPPGWHIPTNSEWAGLYEFLGVILADYKMKSKTGWESYKKRSGNGSNESGFMGLPGGSFDFKFRDIGEVGNWWSFSEKDSDDAFYVPLKNKFDLPFFFSYFDKKAGFSVRCVRD